MMRLLAIVLLSWAGQAKAQYPLPLPADRVRLAETFLLADSIQEMVWKGWSEVPFVVLLLTPDFEYLLRHPSPPDDFESLGQDPVSGEEIFARPDTGKFSLNFLATFPAVAGVNTIVIGQPENTGKSSTAWVVTALHEHFHQYQFTRPWYYESVNGLGLSGGDQSGMWQLNYPFPYQDEVLAQTTRAWAMALKTSLFELSLHPDQKPEDHRLQKAALKAALDDSDYRYLSFQLWQEGVARYIEYKVAEAAAEFHQPSVAFARLDDFIPYAELLKSMMIDLQQELNDLDLAESGRVAFYALGASEALLLDRFNPSWQAQYFRSPFHLDLH